MDPSNAFGSCDVSVIVYETIRKTYRGHTGEQKPQWHLRGHCALTTCFLYGWVKCANADMMPKFNASFGYSVLYIKSTMAGLSVIPKHNYAFGYALILVLIYVC